MGFAKERYYITKTLESGALSSALTKLAEALSSDLASAYIRLLRTLEDGTRFDREKLQTAELEDVCSLDGSLIQIHLKLEQGDIFVNIRGRPSVIEIYASSSRAFDVDTAITTLADALALEEGEPPPATKDSLKDLSRRVSSLETTVLTPKKRLTCFLSYRFTDEAESYAIKMSQFLSLLDVSVLTGAGYEPRRISEKVLSRLSRPLDFVVILATREGESMWTRDEISSAHQRGVPVVPVVETGSAFEPGLFGDLECIRFEAGHVGDAFLKLTEAVHFIREQSRREAHESDFENEQAL